MTGKLSKNFHGVGIGLLSNILAVKVPTLLAVAMDPLNTLERLNIALDEEK